MSKKFILRQYEKEQRQQPDDEPEWKKLERSLPASFFDDFIRIDNGHNKEPSYRLRPPVYSTDTSEVPKLNKYTSCHYPAGTQFQQNYPKLPGYDKPPRGRISVYATFEIP